MLISIPFPPPLSFVAKTISVFNFFSMSIWTCSWSLISLCVIVARKCISYWVLNFFVSYIYLPIRVVVDRERCTCAGVCASLCVSYTTRSNSRSIPFGPEKKEGQIVDDCYLFVTLWWNRRRLYRWLYAYRHFLAPKWLWNEPIQSNHRHLFPDFLGRVSYIISNSGPMTSQMTAPVS